MSEDKYKQSNLSQEEFLALKNKNILKFIQENKSDTEEDNEEEESDSPLD